MQTRRFLKDAPVAHLFRFAAEVAAERAHGGASERAFDLKLMAPPRTSLRGLLSDVMATVDSSGAAGGRVALSWL